MAKKNSKKKRFELAGLWVLVLFFIICFNFLKGQELVNCLVAMVDRVPITWFDLKVIESFQLLSEYEQEGFQSREDLLNKYIERLLVLSLAREQVKITEEEIKAEELRLKNKIGEKLIEEKCRSLGMTEAELEPYLEDKLVFEKIIGSRFNQKLYVSLKEIEDYYQKVYIPEEKNNGRTPAELVTVLDKIEARLQNQKRIEQIKSWTQELKQRAEVIIYPDCLKKVKEGEQE
ncbi:MAG: hypothetical protein ACPLRA_01105 [Candidatus Saccharicenans sp.]